MAGPAALATDDVMESVRSVLSQVLPVTYSDVDPQAYKNVTVCSVGTPTAAPPQQDPGQPGNLAQNKGRLLLQVGGACDVLCTFVTRILNIDTDIYSPKSFPEPTWQWQW